MYLYQRVDRRLFREVREGTRDFEQVRALPREAEHVEHKLLVGLDLDPDVSREEAASGGNVCIPLGKATCTCTDTDTDEEDDKKAGAEEGEGEGADVVVVVVVVVVCVYLCM